MKRVKELILTRAGFSIVSNIITIFAALLLFRPFWEEGDDVGMALLVEGAYGYHESHILYSNTIYGKILCALQSIIPLVRWHSVLMYAFAFVSLTIFVYILSKE